MRDIIDAFNSTAIIYDEWYEHPQGKQVFCAEKKAIDLMIPKTGLGVEIGAGTGIFAESLTCDDRIILCLDPSLDMLKKAKDRCLFCILALGYPLPFRRGLFDFSYMVTVLEFIYKPVVLLNEIRETAKQSAPLSILFINSDSSWGGLYRNIGEKGDPVFQYARLYTHDEVSEMLNEAGYRVTNSKGTLNSGPMNQNVDQRIIEPSEKSGVLIVEAMKMD
ncbi:methylase involved in ubiquinone/menaquinone biosynthesis [Thaumarchaeota archaeon SCGC AB-539-E09]|nr:methylase involved in ubiquinone/menaquinone biosynthesis [Thaumarchaeota archaeon SCGC AB-539-E09]